MSASIGQKDYRDSGHERLREAGILLNRELYAGAVYLGGRAVESMLRALAWKGDADLRAGKKSLETGHDLLELLWLVRNLGLLSDRDPDVVLAAGVQIVGRLWFNNMRFASTAKLKSVWWERGEIGRKRVLKTAVAEYYEACSAVVKRCEVLYAKT
jgi:hypothetical protein